MKALLLVPLVLWSLLAIAGLQMLAAAPHRPGLEQFVYYFGGPFVIGALLLGVTIWQRRRDPSPLTMIAGTAAITVFPLYLLYYTGGV
jgi:hypothetical protein